MSRTIRLLFVICCWAGLLAGATVTAAPIVLYNSTTGQLPSDPTWSWTFSSDGGTANAPAQSVMNYSLYGGVLLLDTANPFVDRAGYSLTQSAFPPGVSLDRNLGFAVSFNIQLLNETATATDDSGFNFLFLTEDRRGIDLGFLRNNIFSRDISGNAAESMAYNNSGMLETYTLSVFLDNYCLSAPGMSTPLVGLLRDYSNAAPAFPPTGNGGALFFGDVSSTAESQTFISQVGYSFVGVAQTIPEPGTWGVLTGIALLTCGRYVAVGRRKKDAPDPASC